MALLGRGLGLKEIEIQRFNKEMKGAKNLVMDEEMSMRNPGMSENADITTNGARPSEIEGMSQMSFHTNMQSALGRGDETPSKASQATYTKPFTV